jgi:RimJ/RimL family protein N-acetyltransferase
MRARERHLKMKEAAPNIPTIQTARLVLRAWTAEDAETLFGILHEKGLLRFFPDPTPPPRGRVEAYIVDHLAHWQERGYGHWAIVTPQDGRVVGWSGLKYLPELEETEVAYLLSRRVWGHGYASEAARAALRFGFEAAGLKKIIGLVHRDNIASISVLEKCGLRFADRVTIWGMELSRFRIDRASHERSSRPT